MGRTLMRSGVLILATWLGLAGCTATTEPARQLTFTVIQGEGAEHVVNGGYPEDSIKVRVTDAGGDPVVGLLVQWDASANGEVGDAETETDADGVATTRGSSNVVGPSQIGVWYRKQLRATITVYGRAGPSYHSLTYPPEVVVTGEGAVSIPLAVTFVTDYLGLEWVYARLRPDGAPPNYVSPLFDPSWQRLSLASGTPQDGIWEAIITMPEGTAPGLYQWQLFYAPWSTHNCSCLGYPRQWTGGAIGSIALVAAPSAIAERLSAP